MRLVRLAVASVFDKRASAAFAKVEREMIDRSGEKTEDNQMKVLTNMAKRLTQMGAKHASRK